MKTLSRMHGTGAVRTAIGTTSRIARHDLLQTTTPSALLHRMATQLRVTRSEVQRVFNQNQTDYESPRAERYERALDKAVRESRITQAQKDQLLEKHQELREYVATQLEKSRQERREAIRSKWNEITKWAQASTIPPQYLGYRLRQQSP